MGSLEELLLNAREHGKTGVRVFLKKLISGDLYFGVLDNGPGIHQTVPRNQTLSGTKDKNPSAIIRLACEEGITGTSILGREVGLFLLADTSIDGTLICVRAQV